MGKLHTLITELQKALVACTELQCQVEVAVQPWGDMIATALMPLEQRLRSVSTAWAQAQAALCQELARQISDSETEQELTFRQTLRRADHIGRLGWTVTWAMTPGELVRLSELQQPDEANEFMSAWYEAYAPDLGGLEHRITNINGLESFRTPLVQCFSAFGRAEYSITIPCLVSVLERGIRNLACRDRFFSTTVEKALGRQCSHAKEHDPDSIETAIWLSLFGFIQWFYGHYGPAQVGHSRVFRHGIQHGTQPPPNEQIEVLRLLNALDSLAGVIPGPKSN